MRNYTKTLVVAAGLVCMAMPGLLAQGNPPAGQRQQQQQMQAQQRQMTQMQQMSQRMEQIRTRAQKMNQDCAAQIQQQGQAQNQTQARTQERTRLMQRLSESIAASADNLKAAADRTQDMLRDRDMLRDHDQQRDMDRLHTSMTAIADQLDSTLRTMDRIRLRLQDATTAAP